MLIAYGFKSRHSHQNSIVILKMGIEKEVAKFALVEASANEGKNSPMDYFSDAARQVPSLAP